MQVTLDALHNHDCHGIYRGNWTALGQGIVEGMHENDISKHVLARATGRPVAWSAPPAVSARELAWVARDEHQQ
jgi:hypothetical protein